MIIEYWWVCSGNGLRGAAGLVRADVTQMRVVERRRRRLDGRWRRARHELHAERLRRDRRTYRALQRWRRSAWRRLHVELVHHAREEHEHLHAREHVAQAHAPAHAERHEVLRPPNLAGLVDEPARVELVRLVPQIGVHVDAVDQRHYLRARRDPVAVQMDVPVHKENLVNILLVGKEKVIIVFLSFETYFVGECVVARGTMLDIRRVSSMVVSVYGRLGMSSMVGRRSRPTTASNSSCTRLFTSGFLSINTIIHRSEDLMVSIPAENRSPRICFSCSSGRKIFINFVAIC